jgi:S-formylglutathione hydrolase FrmB
VLNPLAEASTASIAAVTAGLTHAASRASLMHGFIPAVVEVITGAALLYATGWRARRWHTLWVPLALLFGGVTAAAVHWYYRTLGIASEPAPWSMWLWVSLSGFAVAVAVLGWRSAGNWRRNASVFAMSFCLLSTGLTINGWLGYYPTVYAAWGQLTDAPLPDQTDMGGIQMRRHNGIASAAGAVVLVPAAAEASGFRHRREWVYLPPAWFTSVPPPPLPALLMIGGEFNTPVDWIRAGDAVTALDVFAAAHGGNAPIAVFADATGGFTVDTECVNGVRGNAAQHLSADLINRVDDAFGLGGHTSWGVVGFSSGGTCAVDLAVMHPDTFRAFVDIGGDIAPNAGNRAQTIDRLFGGDANAWSAFDPSTVIARHGRYLDMSGIFAVPGERTADGRANSRQAVGQAAAESLCRLGAAQGISCKIVGLPGKHDWPSASAAFAITLPWLAGRLNTADAGQARSPDTDMRH